MDAPALLQRLAGTLAHELRGVIASVKIDLRSGVDVDDAFLRVERVLRVLARLGLGRLTRTEAFAPRALVDAVAEDMRRDGRWCLVRLTTDGAAAPLEGDPLLLHHALHCLARNGSEACLRRKIEGLHVRVAVADRGDDVVFSIHDEGEGMAPTLLHEALAGATAISTKREPTYAGLGLPTAQLIARYHGGRLEADSQPDAGAIVRLVIPRRPR